MFPKIFSVDTNHETICINLTQPSFIIAFILNVVLPELKHVSFAKMTQMSKMTKFIYTDLFIKTLAFFVSATSKFSENHLVV